MPSSMSLIKVFSRWALITILASEILSPRSLGAKEQSIASGDQIPSTASAPSQPIDTVQRASVIGAFEMPIRDVLVGDILTATLVIYNQATITAEQTTIDLPVPTGVTALPGDGYQTDGTYWRWNVSNLAPNQMRTFTPHMRVTRMP